MRWVPPVDALDGWAITRDKLDTKRLRGKNGSGGAGKWASVSPWEEGQEEEEEEGEEEKEAEEEEEE
jgi:hypothetical protein